MSQDKMREEFEAWSAEHWFLGGIGICRAQNGEYSDADMQISWETWQASRAAVAVERPEKCEFAEPGGAYEKGYRQGMRSMVDAIEAVGLKVAP